MNPDPLKKYLTFCLENWADLETAVSLENKEIQSKLVMLFITQQKFKDMYRNNAKLLYTNLGNLYHYLYLMMSVHENMNNNQQNHTTMTLFLNIIQYMSLEYQNFDLDFYKDKQFKITQNDTAIQLNIERAYNKNQYNVYIKSYPTKNILCKQNIHFSIHTNYTSSVMHLKIPYGTKASDYVNDVPCRTKHYNGDGYNNQCKQSIRCAATKYDNNKITIKALIGNGYNINTALHELNFYATNKIKNRIIANTNGNVEKEYHELHISDYTQKCDNGTRLCNRPIEFNNDFCTVDGSITRAPDGKMSITNYTINKTGMIKLSSDQNASYLRIRYQKTFASGIDSYVNALPDPVYQIKLTDNDKKIMKACYEFLSDRSKIKLNNIWLTILRECVDFFKYAKDLMDVHDKIKDKITNTDIVDNLIFYLTGTASIDNINNYKNLVSTAYTDMNKCLENISIELFNKIKTIKPLSIRSFLTTDHDSAINEEKQKIYNRINLGNKDHRKAFVVRIKEENDNKLKQDIASVEDKITICEIYLLNQDHIPADYMEENTLNNNIKTCKEKIETLFSVYNIPHFTTTKTKIEHHQNIIKAINDYVPIGGDYRYKYIKYKNKYLELKK